MSEYPKVEDPNPPGPEKEKKTLFTRFLDFVEWLGNLLPHPVTLFAIFAIGVVFASGLAEWLNWTAVDPRDPEGNTIIEPVSLMNADGFRMIVENMVTNFTSFAPLGVVLVALLGVGVAEHSGLISACIRGIVLKAASFKPKKKVSGFQISIFESSNPLLKALDIVLVPFRFVYHLLMVPIRPMLNFILIPKNLVTVAICFAAVISNTASEMGYVVLVPLAAVIFHSMGRHPLAGLACAFACVSGGYSANLLIGTIDPLLAGLTQEAAMLIDEDYTVHAAVNYYFMFISTFLITAVGTFVTLKIVEPKLGTYDESMAMEDLSDEVSMDPLSKKELRALAWTGVSVFVMFTLLALTIVPEWGVLRNPETGDILRSPFLNGIVTFIFICFLIPGFVYGRLVGTMKDDRDVIEGMSNAMSTLGLYIVIVFFAAQFVAYFGWSNLGQIFAVKGANFLQDIGMTGPIIFIGFIFVSGSVNLMLGSASAQWAVTAPIFVPMLMLIGYSPEVIQAAYRIGDSVTNIITPMMSYFGLILAFANKYDRDLGIGTIIAMMLPYSIFFLIGWIAIFYLWVFGLGLPVGPEAPTYYIIGE
ncbi:AbgT family transporter [Rhodohalobacter sp. SW132]|uniref:AbgT family transporter n=1 Tax=Rhodohalobacter sp. SW132 TaxID=2293433 RepID=UPI000E26309C|nr:AbgT family transporter [Rhodohalobacter sp. SW132]REL24135.1 AbgT family transporter [Rhodohalobacter sp. SW132]